MVVKEICELNIQLPGKLIYDEDDPETLRIIIDERFIKEPIMINWID